MTQQKIMLPLAALIVCISSLGSAAAQSVDADRTIQTKDAQVAESLTTQSAHDTQPPGHSPTISVKEARARAELLHETIHGALQVMHRDFFREDEKLSLPANSLEDVFKELARSQNVKLRWIAVDTKAMTVDHKPSGKFENAAVKALSSGQKSFEAIEDDTFRYAGPIRLSAHCLKCHAPSRTSNNERRAGLVIAIPLTSPKSDDDSSSDSN